MPSLTTDEIVRDFLKPKDRDEAPFIVARRYLVNKLTYDIKDTTFEGLTPKIENGQTVFEINRSFVLKINGQSGLCKIPDTPFNRKRLKKLSRSGTRPGTKVILDQETGMTKSVSIEIKEPAMYERVEESLMKKSVMNELMDEIREKLSAEGILPGGQMNPKSPQEEYEKPHPNIVMAQEPAKINPQVSNDDEDDEADEGSTQNELLNRIDE